MSQTLQAFANEMEAGPVAERLKDIARQFDCLLQYRNYYVHGIWTIMPGEGDEAGAGWIQHYSAKNRLQLHSEGITKEDLDLLAERSLALLNAVVGLQFHLFFGGQKPPLLAMPPQPPPLLKSPRPWPPR